MKLLSNLIRTSNDQESGFTAVELLITIIVAGIFAVSFYQLFMIVNQATSLARNRATASDIAYANLRKYASAGVTPDSWSPKFVCSASNDRATRSTATGTTLASGSLSPSTSGLPGPASYSIVALAVYGCSGVNLNKPVRVVSTVTFGPQNTVIQHATLVGY